MEWMPWLTNYGISSSVWRYPYGTDSVVLVDYPELIVDLEAPLEVDEKLNEATRHLNKVNVLRADGSVKTTWPTSISPRLYPEAWEPEVEAKPE
jgi:prepilin-type processing-associated H-X9-DG protein